MLIVVFYILLVSLYFVRRSARATSESQITKALAVIATFLPFLISFVSKPLDNPALVIAADLIVVVGMAFSVYALSMLGRSFSIVPQARKLVNHGPYRLIRHPLYLGELATIFGVILVSLATLSIILFIVLCVLQIYRALEEEKLLTGMFPEYKEYSSRTARFIPGLF